METSPAQSGAEVHSPTLPLPPPAAGQIAMEDFIESATRAVLRALESSSLNPQPLPPGPDVELKPQPEPPGAAAGLNPQPLPPRDIIVGIILSPREISAAARESRG
jgi:hypothetical protein